MNKTQRWNYEELQTFCDRIAAMGKTLVDFADATLCGTDPENITNADIERCKTMLSHLQGIFAQKALQEHCSKLGIDTTEDWADIYHNLPELLKQADS